MSEEKLEELDTSADAITADEPDENPFEEGKEKVFDDNVEIIDYDIDDKITVNDFNKHDKKPETKDDFNLKAEIISWIKMFVAAAIIAFVIVEFIIINATVPTGSMEKTILPGDRILGSRLTYLFSEPERGDIIVFKYQFEENTDYVKRIIGLPGETVTIQNGEIYIYEGEKLIEGPLKEDYINGEWIMKNDGYTFTVPEGRYLVLGDNRNNSKDARWWYDEIYLNGDCSESDIYVSKDQILGKVYFRYWSTQDKGITEKFKNLNK
ncbi:MAG: signal peptidase I [Lachnospiraceae bacterium]|nr:signal peptidase I [Lachnospiraceae bacterium]